MMKRMSKVLAMTLCLTIGMTLFPFRSFAETEVPAEDEIINITETEPETAETEPVTEELLSETPPETPSEMPAETPVSEEPETLLSGEDPAEEQAQKEEPDNSEKENEEPFDPPETTGEQDSTEPAVTPDVPEVQENAEPDPALIPEKETEGTSSTENTSEELHSEATAEPVAETNPLEEDRSEENREEAQPAELFETDDITTITARFGTDDTITFDEKIGATVTLEVIIDWLDDPSLIRYSWYNYYTGEQLDETSNKLTVQVRSRTEEYRCQFIDAMPELEEITFRIHGRELITQDDLAGLTIQEIGLNETGTASIKTEGELAYFSYTCSESGKYEFATSPMDARTEVSRIDPDDNEGRFIELSRVGGRQAGDQWTSVYELEAGTTYYISFFFDPYYSQMLTGDVTLQINKEVSVGESVTAELAAPGDVVYYSFTPNESGPYALIPDMSGAGPDISTTVLVYDKYENIISYDNTAILEAGRTYCFAVCLETGSNASIPLTLVASNQLKVKADRDIARYVRTSEEVEMLVNVTAVDYSGISYAWTKEGSNEVIGTEDRLTVLSAASEGITDIYYCKVSDQYGNTQTLAFSVNTVQFEIIGDGSTFEVNLPKDSPSAGGNYRFDYFFKPNETGCYEFTADFSDGSIQRWVEAEWPTVFGNSISEGKLICNGDEDFPDKGIVRVVLQAGTEYYFEIFSETWTPVPFSVRVFPANACGEEATWAYADGTLTISGSGSTWYYAGIDYAWVDYTTEITQVVAEEGITELVFSTDGYHHSGVGEIRLPVSLEKLSRIDGSVQNGLTLRYAGTKAQWAAVDKSECDLTDVTVLCSDGAADEEMTWTFDESTGTLTISGNGGINDPIPWIDIREQIRRVIIEPGITSIGNGAFFECNLETLTIPDSVESIGLLAFYGNEMTSVEIPASVSSIGNGAFSGCRNMTQITVQGGNSAYIDIDGVLYTKDRETLLQCPAGKAEISIPSGVKHIYGRSFYGCEYLTSVEFPDSVESIGEYAFFGCLGLTEVEIPAGVSSIGDGAFSGCRNMTRITVQNGNSAYIDIDGVLYTKDRETLLQCPAGKTEVSISTGVKHIDGHSFDGCKYMTSVEFPEGTESIGIYAFYGCESLTEVTIPASVTRIEHHAFDSEEGTTNLTTVYYSGAEEDWNAISFDEGNDGLLNATILFGEELGELTLEAVGGETVFTVAYGEKAELQVAATPSRPSDQLSYSWTYTTDWTESGEPETAALAETGSSIETEAIKRPYRYVCTVTDQRGKTASVEFRVDYSRPDGFVGNGITWSFDGSTLTLSGVGEVWDYYPNSGVLPPWAGVGDQITGIDLDEGITVIGKSAFRGLANVERVNIPVTVTKIGNDAFSGCEGLRNGRVRYGSLQEQWDKIEIGSGNEMLSEAEYYVEEGSCGDSLNWILKLNGELRISGTGSIKDYTGFDAPWRAYGDGMRALVIEDGVTGIGFAAFDGCRGLRSAEIPEGIVSIGDYAFRQCARLKGQVLPESLEYIGEAAFQDCASLTGVTIGDRLSYLGRSAFSACGSLQAFTVDTGNTFFTTVDGVLFNPEQTILLAYPGGRPEQSYMIPEGVETVGYDAFGGCITLAELYMPDSLTEIEEYGFESCTSLRSVSFGNGMDRIGTAAFFHCVRLEELFFSENLRIIGNNAFNSCVSLTELIIPRRVTEIEENAFHNCGGLVSITLPGSLERIGRDAFGNCQNMENVSYTGSAEAWPALSAESGLEQATLFTMEDVDAELDVTIETEAVPGGITVTLESAGGENLRLYYTLDGSMPGPESIPYEGAFFLNQAGEYHIQAIALDEGSGKYSDISTAVFSLEQSVQPAFETRDGQIHIVPAESVYYTLDLIEEPTRESRPYTGPITPTANMMIKARIIEEGKAQSETTAQVFQAETAGGLDYPADSYSFKNVPESFGYGKFGYRISDQRYGEVFGRAAGALLYEAYNRPWGGSCFGMSTTALMFRDRTLTLGDYNPDAADVFALDAPRSRESELTKLIERYQVAQFLPEVMMERDDPSMGGTMVISGAWWGNKTEGDALIAAVERACSGEEPIVLILWRQELAGSHAVVPYRMEEGKIYLYDCDKPEKENVLQYRVDKDGKYWFTYGQYSYAASYNRLSTLLEGLEGLQSGRVSLMAGEKEMLLLALNTSSFTILKEDGTTVTDYIPCRETEDMLTDRTLLYVEKGSYIIRNTDPTVTRLEVSLASGEEYFRAEVEDADAEIGIGELYGHLFISLRTENPREMRFGTSHVNGRDNELVITADYAKTYAGNEKAVLVETTAENIMANGNAQMLSENVTTTGTYLGAAMQKQEKSALQGFSEGGITLSTDITELPESGAYALSVYTGGVGDSAVVCTASYDDAGKMLSVRLWETEQGKIRYPSAVPDGTAEVRVFLLEKTGYTPLTEMLQIGRE